MIGAGAGFRSKIGHGLALKDVGIVDLSHQVSGTRPGCGNDRFAKQQVNPWLACQRLLNKFWTKVNA
jgi:hypothetical protein